MAQKKTTPLKAAPKKIATPAKSKKAKLPATPAVRVKSGSDVTKTISNLLIYNLHDRYTFEFSKQTKTKLVAYGPWLSALFVLVLSPQLLNLAKNSELVSVSGFFNQIFFNQQSWLILVVILLNVLFLVDGLSDLFERTKRGWTRVYITSLTTLGYVVWQLAMNISHPAAPILSLIGALAAVFTVLDVRRYYN